ncbi:hypothetical protein [Clostridium aciditolerans]|uniref:Uncharacterized protein n=1 Tax=Clostridium aciditolerans TaxID=339861 RepID=A0A934I3H6_9CLOT|nr:hypothetical protein [Clostridium aciditolerans]MBI6875603.1 hypothetical protein [Clostridium aciditolerans]
MEFIKKIKKELKNNETTRKHYIWDELEYSKLLLARGKGINEYSLVDAFILAKYFLHNKGLNNDNTYNKLCEFFKFRDKFSSYYFEMFLELKIKSLVKSAKLQYLKRIHEVKITKNEINIINSMPNDRIRKIAFTLLCMFKANNYKPFRCRRNVVAREVELNINSDDLLKIYSYLIQNNFLEMYNKGKEKRKQLLKNMIEIDEKYGEMFIPYDSYIYERHIHRPRKKTGIQLWIYKQNVDENIEETLQFTSYYKNLTVEEKEEYKKRRYRRKNRYGITFTLEYIKKEIDFLCKFLDEDEFAELIEGEVFYRDFRGYDKNSRNKNKILFADSNDTEGKVIDVDNIVNEYNKIFKDKKINGKCGSCGCEIIKNSNRQKYCDECKKKIKNEQVKANMKRMREMKNVIH